jgi:hypothetical protein
MRVSRGAAAVPSGLRPWVGDFPAPVAEERVGSAFREGFQLDWMVPKIRGQRAQFRSGCAEVSARHFEGDHYPPLYRELVMGRVR